MVAGMLFGANPAAADSVQVQSFQRASQTATCDSPPESMTEWRASWANPYDPISGPTWHPTWEQWANNGNGGWTCTRSITWARTPVAASNGDGSVTYTVGPGGGLVFLNADGLTYEMAPKTWSGGIADPLKLWCNTDTNIPGAVGTAIGTGAANTVAMDTACTSGAGQEAADYTGGGQNDWFLPSKDELGAMYSFMQSVPENLQDTYGFTLENLYWSSSQGTPTSIAWGMYSETGQLLDVYMKAFQNLLVRPIRAY